MSLRSSSTMVFNSFFYFKRSYIYSTISSFDLVSQIPSQPMMIKSSSGCRSTTWMSGLAVMGHSSGFRSLFTLYLRSPRDLLRLRLPSTRPSVTWLPAFSIRLSSISSSGLWSKESGKALPPRPNTHLESPALAAYIFYMLSISITFAVQPIESNISWSLLWSPPALFPLMSPSSLKRGALLGGFFLFMAASSSLPGSFSSSSSILRKLYLRAASRFPLLYPSTSFKYY